MSPKSPVPAHIRRPPYADKGNFPPWADRSQVHNEEVRGRGVCVWGGGCKYQHKLNQNQRKQAECRQRR